MDAKNDKHNELLEYLKSISQQANAIGTTRVKNTDLSKKRERIDNKDKQTDTKLKKKFANWFIGILIGQLSIMNIIFFSTGIGWLKFSDYTINLYMTGTLIEIFGIVLVMVKYLYSKH